ncbi:hypothetical protein, partial [Polaromonas sp.]|uniref:hypothetical protein n=1 Tax=Polaromonas sp. TaxID=1869339 RepID=UPI002600057F
STSQHVARIRQSLPRIWLLPSQLQPRHSRMESDYHLFTDKFLLDKLARARYSGPAKYAQVIVLE